MNLDEWYTTLFDPIRRRLLVVVGCRGVPAPVSRCGVYEDCAQTSMPVISITSLNCYYSLSLQTSMCFRSTSRSANARSRYLGRIPSLFLVIHSMLNYSLMLKFIPPQKPQPFPSLFPPNKEPACYCPLWLPTVDPSAPAPASLGSKILPMTNQHGFGTLFFFFPFPTCIHSF